MLRSTPTFNESHARNSAHVEYVAERSADVRSGLRRIKVAADRGARSAHSLTWNKPQRHPEVRNLGVVVLVEHLWNSATPFRLSTARGTTFSRNTAVCSPFGKLFGVRLFSHHLAAVSGHWIS